VPVAVAHDERGPSKNTNKAGQPNEESRLLEHLPDRRIRRGFGRFDRATRQNPDVPFRVSSQEDPAIAVTQRDCRRWDLQQLLAAHDITKVPDVISHLARSARQSQRVDAAPQDESRPDGTHDSIGAGQPDYRPEPKH
jgi:hypothetical protein